MAVSVKGLLAGTGAVGLGAAGWAARGLGMGPVMLAGAAAGGLFGSAYKKFGSGGGGDADDTKPPVIPQDKMTGDGVPGILDEIRNEVSAIKDILTSQPDPASQEREKALDEEARQRKLIQAISGIKFGKAGKDKPRGFWEWLKALLPGILALAGIAAIPKILENLPEIFENIQNIVDKIGAFLTSLDNFFTMLGVEFAGAALMGIGKGMRVISRFVGKTPKPGPKGKPVKKPGRMALMMKNLKAKFKSFGRTMMRGINKVYNKAVRGLGKMFRSFGKAFSKGYRAVKGVAGRGITAMKDWAKKFDFKGKMSRWGTAVKNWGSRFSARALGWWKAIDELKTSTVTRISTAWKDFKTQANAKITSMAKTFKANMMSLANRALTGIRGLGTKITTGLSDLTKGARGFTNGLKISAQGHMALLADSFDDFKTKLKGKFDTHSSNLKTNFDDFKTKLKGKFDTHTTNLRSTWSRFSTSLSQKWSGPGGIRDSFDGKVKGFRTSFNTWKADVDGKWKTFKDGAKIRAAGLTASWDKMKKSWKVVQGGWSNMTKGFKTFTSDFQKAWDKKFPKTVKLGTGSGGPPGRAGGIKATAYGKGFDKIDWEKKGGTGGGRGAMVEKPGQRVAYKNAKLQAMRWTQMGKTQPSLLQKLGSKTDPKDPKVGLGKAMANKYPKLMKFLTKFGGKALGLAGIFLLLYELGSLTKNWADAKPWYDVNPFGDDEHDEVFKKGVYRLASTYGGGFLGAILGGFLGTIVGGPVGGFVGSLIGGVGGAIGGDKLFQWLTGSDEVPNSEEQTKNEQKYSATQPGIATVVGADNPVTVTPETSGQPLGPIVSQAELERTGQYLIKSGPRGIGQTIIYLDNTNVNSSNTSVSTSNSTAAAVTYVRKRGPSPLSNRFGN